MPSVAYSPERKGSAACRSTDLAEVDTAENQSKMNVTKRETKCGLWGSA